MYTSSFLHLLIPFTIKILSTSHHLESRQTDFFRYWLPQVDISTMLEEAVQYVKFLQLQIKVRNHIASNSTWALHFQNGSSVISQQRKQMLTNLC